MVKVLFGKQLIANRLSSKSPRTSTRSRSILPSYVHEKSSQLLTRRRPLCQSADRRFLRSSYFLSRAAVLHRVRLLSTRICVRVCVYVYNIYKKRACFEKVMRIRNTMLRRVYIASLAKIITVVRTVNKNKNGNVNDRRPIMVDIVNKNNEKTCHWGDEHEIIGGKWRDETDSIAAGTGCIRVRSRCWTRIFRGLKVKRTVLFYYLHSGNISRRLS